MDKKTISIEEVLVAADKVNLSINAEMQEAVRVMLENWVNDCNELCDEMSKPEYNSLFPAVVTKL